MGEDQVKDTEDLLAEQDAAGQPDPDPEEVTDPDDPSYVEPYQPATPVDEDGAE